MPQALLIPLDHLVFKDPTGPAPIAVDYQQSARQLKPLVDRLANGDELTCAQLSAIVVNGWRVSEGAQNLLTALTARKEDTGRFPACTEPTQ